MNKIYKLKYSKQQNQLVVVSELATNEVAAKTSSNKTTTTEGQSKVALLSKLTKISLASLATLSLSGLFTTTALASDARTGFDVVSGQATMNTVGNLTTITNSNNAILNWDKFNINKDEIVKFVQESAQSAVLNRVLGGQVSQILGQLQSNGKVFIVNPAGIVFGQGSTVNVQSLVASTLDITNENFKAGKYVFNQEKDQALASVVSAGMIKVADDGSIALVGGQVVNKGVLEARNGSVYLLAGNSIQISDLNNPNISYKVTAKNKAVNLGSIVAKNVTLAANKVANGYTADSSFADIFTAEDAQVKGASISAKGEVLLFAGHQEDQALRTDLANDAYSAPTNLETAGLAINNGQIVVTNASGKAGTVKVLADYVALEQESLIDASGAQGGEVYIGGDFSGEGSMKLATATYLDNSQVVNVSANGALDTTVSRDQRTQSASQERGLGDAGKVAFWGDRIRIAGTVHGTSENGRAAFVETSGHYFKLSDELFTAYLGSNGNALWAGTWLLDPNNIYIVGDAGDIDKIKSEYGDENVSACPSTTSTENGCEYRNDGLFLKDQNKSSYILASQLKSILDGKASAAGGHFQLTTIYDAQGGKTGNIIFYNATIDIGTKNTSLWLNPAGEGKTVFDNSTLTTGGSVGFYTDYRGVDSNGKGLSQQLKGSVEIKNSILKVNDIQGDTPTIKLTNSTLEGTGVLTLSADTIESTDSKFKSGNNLQIKTRGDKTAADKGSFTLTNTSLESGAEGAHIKANEVNWTVSSSQPEHKFLNGTIEATKAISISNAEGNDNDLIIEKSTIESGKVDISSKGNLSLKNSNVNASKEGGEGTLTLTGNKDLNLEDSFIKASNKVSLDATAGGVSVTKTANSGKKEGDDKTQLMHIASDNGEVAITAGGKLAGDETNGIKFNGGQVVAKTNIALTTKENSGAGMTFDNNTSIVANNAPTELGDDENAVIPPTIVLNSDGNINTTEGKFISNTGIDVKAKKDINLNSTSADNKSGFYIEKPDGGSVAEISNININSSEGGVHVGQDTYIGVGGNDTSTTLNLNVTAKNNVTLKGKDLNVDGEIVINSTDKNVEVDSALSGDKVSIKAEKGNVDLKDTVTSSDDLTVLAKKVNADKKLKGKTVDVKATEGDATLADVEGKKSVSVTGTNVVVKDVTTTSDNADVDINATTGNVTLNGPVNSKGNFNITAGQNLVSNAPTITAGSQKTGKLKAGNDLTINGTTVDGQDQLDVAGKNISLKPTEPTDGSEPAKPVLKAKGPINIGDDNTQSIKAKDAQILNEAEIDDEDNAPKAAITIKAPAKPADDAPADAPKGIELDNTQVQSVNEAGIVNLNTSDKLSLTNGTTITANKEVNATAKAYELNNSTISVYGNNKLLKGSKISLKGTDDKPVDMTIVNSTVSASKGNVDLAPVNNFTLTNSTLDSKGDINVTQPEGQKGDFVIDKGSKILTKGDLTLDTKGPLTIDNATLGTNKTGIVTIKGKNVEGKPLIKDATISGKKGITVENTGNATDIEGTTFNSDEGPVSIQSGPEGQEKPLTITNSTVAAGTSVDYKGSEITLNNTSTIANNGPINATATTGNITVINGSPLTAKGPNGNITLDAQKGSLNVTGPGSDIYSEGTGGINATTNGPIEINNVNVVAKNGPATFKSTNGPITLNTDTLKSKDDLTVDAGNGDVNIINSSLSNDGTNTEAKVIIKGKNINTTNSNVTSNGNTEVIANDGNITLTGANTFKSNNSGVNITATDGSSSISTEGGNGGAITQVADENGNSSLDVTASKYSSGNVNVNAAQNISLTTANLNAKQGSVTVNSTKGGVSISGPNSTIDSQYDVNINSKKDLILKGLKGETRGLANFTSESGNITLGADGDENLFQFKTAGGAKIAGNGAVDLTNVDLVKTAGDKSFESSGIEIQDPRYQFIDTIRVISKEGNVVLKGANVSAEAGKDVVIEAPKKITISGNSNITAKENINITSKEDLDIKNTNLTATEKDVNLNSTTGTKVKDTLVKAGGNVTSTSEGKNDLTNVTSTAGVNTTVTGKDVNVKDSNVTSNGTNKVEAKENANITNSTVKAEKENSVKGKNVNVKDSNVTSSGTNKVEAEENANVTNSTFKAKEENSVRGKNVNAKDNEFNAPITRIKGDKSTTVDSNNFINDFDGTDRGAVKLIDLGTKTGQLLVNRNKSIDPEPEEVQQSTTGVLVDVDNSWSGKTYVRNFITKEKKVEKVDTGTTNNGTTGTTNGTNDGTGNGTNDGTGNGTTGSNADKKLAKEAANKIKFMAKAEILEKGDNDNYLSNNQNKGFDNGKNGEFNTDRGEGLNKAGVSQDGNVTLGEYQEEQKAAEEVKVVKRKVYKHKARRAKASRNNFAPAKGGYDLAMGRCYDITNRVIKLNKVKPADYSLTLNEIMDQYKVPQYQVKSITSACTYRDMKWKYKDLKSFVEYNRSGFEKPVPNGRPSQPVRLPSSSNSGRMPVYLGPQAAK